MKFSTKITFLVVFALLLGSTVCAHAFLAPGVNPLPFGIQRPSQISFAVPAPMAKSDLISLVPDARPASFPNELQTEKLFQRSA